MVTVNLINSDFKFKRQWEQQWQQKEITQVFMADKDGKIYNFNGDMVAIANAPGFMPPPNAPVITVNPAVQIPPANQYPKNIAIALAYPNGTTAYMNPQPVFLQCPPHANVGDVSQEDQDDYQLNEGDFLQAEADFLRYINMDQVEDAPQQVSDATHQVADASYQVPDASSASAPCDSEDSYGCKCGKPNTENDMILCEETIHGSPGRWFHYECVGLTHDQAVRNPHWLCEECRAGRTQAENNDNPSDDDKQPSEPSTDDHNDDDFGGSSGSRRKKSSNPRKRKPQNSSNPKPNKRRKMTPKSSDHKNEDSSAPTPRQIRNDRSIASPSNARNLDHFASHSRPGTEKRPLSDSFDPRPRKRVKSISPDADLYNATPPRTNDDELYQAALPRRNEDDFRASLIRSSRPGDLLKISYDEDGDIQSGLQRPDDPKLSNFQPSKHPQKHGELKKPHSSSTVPRSREGSTTTDNKAKPTPWSDQEKAQVVQLMQDVIDEGEVNHTEKRWTVISDRLASQFNSIRTKTAVKNYWNREGRQKSGLEERKKARSNRLVTGVQSAASRKATRQKKKAEKEGAQKDDISSDVGAEQNRHWDEDDDEYGECDATAEINQQRPSGCK